ncbi:MAG: slipin family protein [Actinomycetia bacterium]|nr:slipin family protein [Actinomycetes bacterium]
MEFLIVFLFFLFLFSSTMLLSAVKIIPEYERGVVFRLGRYQGTRGPGVVILIPVFEVLRRIDLRIITMDVPPQDVITKDNVTVKVDAVVYYHVQDPASAVIKVENFHLATSKFAQTTLRSVTGQCELDELLTHREEISNRIRKIVDKETDPWGVKVTIVEIKAIDLPEGMVRAMAKQAEAERERRAKIIHAIGEAEASKKLTAAAEVLSRVPAAIQLRFLQTLTEIAVEKNSTILFPVPVDIINKFFDNTKK